MKILVWHGYLLTGSGSNVYTANIARSWRKRGHHVLVLCQERHPEHLAFVDEAGVADAAGMKLDALAPSDTSSGWCAVARPDIRGLLPVYVYDEYEGFEVKVFPDLSEKELDTYIRLNVEALVAAIRRFTPDIIITGHEVMGPHIARLACGATGTRYIAKLHGSALEYAVKKQSRYRDYASSGLAAAHRVVGGSRYMLREAAAHVPGWERNGVVINPGCDVDLFAPVDKSPGSRTVGYVGKFMAAKGVHNLLAALPLASAERAVIVGYGELDRELRELAHALSRADLDAAKHAVQSIDTATSHHLKEFLQHAPGDYPERAAAVDVTFTGRLDHEPLARVLPTFDALAVPSVVPEAFGMVAAEAAAAGVLPVVPSHSGIAEAGAAVEAAIGRPGFLTYDAEDPVRGLGRALDRVLSMPHEERAAAEASAVEMAGSRWSWDRVADALAAVAQE